MNKTLKKIYFFVVFGLLVYFLQPKGGTWFYLHNCRWLYVLILSFLLANFIVPFVKRLAIKFNLLDYPDARKIHKTPIPRIGGLAIFLTIVIVFIRNLHFNVQVTGLIYAATIIFLLGFGDDIKGLSATTRLFGQLIAIFVLILHNIRITFIPHIPFENVIEITLTIVWILGITNAINLLDGMDGLATGISLISALCFFIIVWHTKQDVLSYTTIAIVGSCLGFLPYNIKPAKIFLGDSGSTLLGFMLASIAIIGTWEQTNPVIAAVIPLLILGLPIFDTTYITISRVKNKIVRSVKEWLEYVGKDHFHHRLVKIGLKEEHAVAFIYAVNLLLGLSAIVLREASTISAMLLFLQALIVFLIIIVLMLAGRDLS
jgi:UDP-GlcNAc:undecaprenyl-phosphate GlcNAc-1-phosphate transferase